MEDEGQAMRKRRKPPLPTWAVVAVCFGVVAAVSLFVGVPASKASRRSASEAVAVRTLQAIAAGRRAFHKERGVYGTFAEPGASGALGGRFPGESPAVVGGYVFVMKVSPRAGASPETFSLSADPLHDDGSAAGGRRHFHFSASDGGIRHSVGRPAGPSDPPLSAPPNR